MSTAVSTLETHPELNDPDRFVVIPDVPVFREHVLELADGERIKLSYAELAKIAENCNRRIEATGDYVPVTVGHTSPTGDKQPPTIGFAGPFRVTYETDGLGRRYAKMTADFHIFHERLEDLKKYPRRSPELWRIGPVDQWFLDPIALISEPPRLDMGLLYYTRLDGRTVEKYALACPSATNVFAPQAVERKGKPEMDKDEYQAGLAVMGAIEAAKAAGQGLEQAGQETISMATEPYQGQPSDKIDPKKAREILHDKEVHGHPLTEKQRRMFGAAASKENYQSEGNGLSEQDVQKIVDALFQAPLFQQIVQKLGLLTESPAGEGDTVSPEGTAGSSKGTTEPAAEEVSDRKTADTTQYENAAETQGGELVQETNAADKETPADEGDAMKVIAELKKEIADLKKQLEAEREKRIDTERYSRLHQLNQQYLFDLGEEFALCRYSRMTEEQFQQHVEKVIPRYKENPAAVDLVTFDNTAPRERYERNADGGVTRTRYGQDVADRALTLAVQEGISFEKALARLTGEQQTA